jgi:hypothetical protein
MEKALPSTLLNLPAFPERLHLIGGMVKIKRNVKGTYFI